MKLTMLVTCPESAHLEEIEYIEHPLGLLVAKCSAWPRNCPGTCPRTCAARLDVKCRLDKQVEPGTVLIVRSCLRNN